MELVPLCAADDGHHGEHHPDDQAEVHVQNHNRQPGHHPHQLYKHMTTIPSMSVWYLTVVSVHIKSPHNPEGSVFVYNTQLISDCVTKHVTSKLSVSVCSCINVHSLLASVLFRGPAADPR